MALSYTGLEAGFANQQTKLRSRALEGATDKITVTVTVTFDAPATDCETADVLHKITTALPRGHVKMRVEGVTRELQAVWVTALALAKAKDSARKSTRSK